MQKKLWNACMAAIMAASLLAGCGNTKDSENTEKTAEKMVEESGAQEEAAAEEAAAEEATAEEDGAEMEENVQDIQYATAKDWVTSLNLEKPTLLIWNEQTMENSVLEEGEEYQLKENDKILLAENGKLEDFTFKPGEIFGGLETSFKEYQELFVDIEGRQDITVYLTVDGEDYEITATFIGIGGEVLAEESSEITSIEEIDLNSDLPGEEWAASLGTEIEEIFMAVWNDTEGTKKILEEGEKHQIKEDDVFFLYTGVMGYLAGTDFVHEPVPDSGKIESEGLEIGWMFRLDESDIQQNGEEEFSVDVFEFSDFSNPGNVIHTYILTK